MNQHPVTRFDAEKQILFKWQRTAILALVLFVVTIGTACDAGGVLPPATITFRESLLDSTRVMQVTNRSGSETLVMKLDVYNDAYNQHGQLVFKVKPGATYEIGRLEMGWLFRRGERFTLKADGYVIPIEDTVP
jgi:hypothetical protein